MIQLEVWSDIACPWCYIGARRLANALSRYEHSDQVEVTWRAFELDPAAPEQTDTSIVDLLAAKYGRSAAEARLMVENMVGVARELGLPYDHEIQRPSNTFRAHQLIKLADRSGLGEAMADRLYRAYFAEGRLLADVDTLVELASEVGLDPALVRGELGSPELQRAVREDEQVARQLGITGVPCFVLDRRFGVSGAQPPELLIEAFEQARVERAGD